MPDLSALRAAQAPVWTSLPSEGGAPATVPAVNSHYTAAVPAFPARDVKIMYT